METVNNIVNAASKMVYGETNDSTTSTENTTTGSTTTGNTTTGNTTTGNTTTGNTTTEQSSGSLLGDEGTTTTSTNNNNNNTISTSDNTTGGQEPLSGKTGAGTAGEPYDSGNTTGEPTNTTSSSTGRATESETGPSSSSDNDPTSTGSSGSDALKSSSTATTAQDVGSAPPESGAKPQVKQQGASNPNDTPDAAQTDALENKREAADDAMAEESAKDTGAPDAGAGSSGGPSDEAGPKPLSEKAKESKGSSDDKDQLGSTSKEEGTGEKYIKSSGTKADGGDFDASNAGAGREADRLLEEKGIVREEGNTGPPADVPDNKPGASSTASDGKPSLGQKLKDKLHIKSKDKP